MRIHIPISKDPHRVKKVPVRHGSVPVVIILVFFVLFIIFGYGVYKVNHVDNLAQIQYSKSLSSNSINYLSKISKLMLLPVDSKPPRILEVTNPVLLYENESFYKGAEAGDILVIFDESKKAILYSPRRDIILNAGPIVYKNKASNDADKIVAKN